MSYTFVKTTDRNKCVECESHSLTEKGGETFCKACGMVYGDYPIQTQENNFHEDDHQGHSNEKRTGNLISYSEPDQGMKTKIGNHWERRNSYNPPQYSRLQKWQQRWNGTNRSRGNLLRHIKDFSSQLNLPRRVKEEATRTGWRAIEEEVTKGRSRESVASGIIHLVSREAGYGVTLSELSEVSATEEKKIGSAYRQITRRLDRDYAPMKASHLIFRYADKLDAEHPEKAYKLAEKVDDTVKLQNRSRSTLASACIYIVEHLHGDEEEAITQDYIAEHIDVSKTSVRDNYQAITEELAEDKDGFIEMVENL